MTSSHEHGSAPKTVSANSAIDFAVDTAQNLKNFIVKAQAELVEAGEGAVAEINDTLDDLIDRLQKLKG